MLWALVAVGVLAALVSAAARWRVEARNRRVEITLDYSELRRLAAAQGVPLPDVLRRFRAAGATSVALQEESIGSLEEARRIEVVGAGRNTASLLPEQALTARILEAIRNKTRLNVRAAETARGTELSFDQPLALVRGVALGLDPQAVADARAAGLGVVGRVGNWEGVTPEGVRWTLAQLKSQGVETVIFSGDEVLGFKGYIAADKEEPTRPSTESVLREQGLYFGTVEFVKQKGNDLLARAAQDRTVRVHTVSGAEMIAADIPGNIQRFLLAARERNIRLLFVRLFTQEPDALAKNVEYVEKLTAGLKRGDLTPGPAHGYNDLHTPLILRLLMGLGLAAAWCLLLDALTGFISRGGLGIISIPVAASLALLPGVGETAGPKLAALAAACLFPTLALLHADLLRPAPGGRQGLAPRAALEYAFRRFLAMTGITLMGAMLIVGLLADRVFLIKADAFAGIKVAQLIPIAAAAVVYFLGLQASPERPWPRVVDEARRKVIYIGTQPILLWQVAAALGALVLLAIVVLRSGNDPGVGVSGLELRVRGLLDRLLFTRPRFKEFLIGHPAMILALALGATGRRLWAFPLFLVGAIGQVSLLNTFCHLHTPLLVSLLRALLGFSIGIVFGAVAYLLLERLLRRMTSGATRAG